MREKLWFIHAYDNIYGGLHGMHDLAVARCTEQEAKEIGEELSLDVIYCFNEISATLLKDAEAFQDTADENDVNIYSEELEEYVQDDIAYGIYEITDNKGLSPAMLERKANRLGPEYFIKEFCK